MSETARRIPLDRRVCVVGSGRIDLRPERAAVIGPLIGLMIGAGLFVAVGLFGKDLPAWALAAMLIPGIIIAPFSAMGLLYSLIGAAVVIETKKQSVRFQQGVLGLGLGTQELAPFWKIDHIEVEDFEKAEEEDGGPRLPVGIRGWDIVLVKKSGKRLWVAQVLTATAPDLIDEAFGRALDAAEAIATMTSSPLLITAAVEEEAETDAAPEAAREDAAGRAEPAAG